MLHAYTDTCLSLHPVLHSWCNKFTQTPVSRSNQCSTAGVLHPYTDTCVSLHPVLHSWCTPRLHRHPCLAPPSAPQLVYSTLTQTPVSRSTQCSTAGVLHAYTDTRVSLHPVLHSWCTPCLHRHPCLAPPSAPQLVYSTLTQTPVSHSTQCSTAGVTKAGLLSVGWCIIKDHLLHTLHLCLRQVYATTACSECAR